MHALIILTIEVIPLYLSRLWLVCPGIFLEHGGLRLWFLGPSTEVMIDGLRRSQEACLDKRNALTIACKVYCEVGTLETLRVHKSPVLNQSQHERVAGDSNYRISRASYLS